MTDFEKAVKIIAESYREDCEEYDCNIRELFKIYGYDTKDLKEEFWYILHENNFEGEYTDDCEIFYHTESETKFKTFRSLAKAVRDYRL